MKLDYKRVRIITEVDEDEDVFEVNENELISKVTSFDFLMEVTSKGKLKGRSITLSDYHNWTIVKDENDSIILLPTIKD